MCNADCEQTETVMTEVERIADQLQRAFEGPAWASDSVAEILKGVTAAQASARPISGAHTIWEIVRHMAVWLTVGAKRVQQVRFQPTAAEDWPPVSEHSEAAWQQEVARLEMAYQDLRTALAGFAEAGLETVPEGFQSTPYMVLHGVVQHCVYHAGQISLLKKMVAAR
jgi:uncharacterized damage-inducible protein DinB